MNLLSNVLSHMTGKRKQLLEDFLFLRFRHILLSEQTSNHSTKILGGHTRVLRILIVLYQKLVHLIDELYRQIKLAHNRVRKLN